MRFLAIKVSGMKRKNRKKCYGFFVVATIINESLVVNFQFSVQ